MKGDKMKKEIKMSHYDSLHNLFSNNINITHISEKLVSCNYQDNAKDIKKKLIKKNFDVIGVEKNNEVIGFLERETLKGGKCEEYLQYFSSSNLISESTSIKNLLPIFNDKLWVFVLEENKVNKIVTRADLQKTPVRLLLFGMFSLLEMNLLKIIEKFYEKPWQEDLNDKRLNKAKKLLEKRKKRNEEIDLIDCLQLSDKKELVVKNKKILNLFGLSKTKTRKVMKKIQKLRNKLAHSQDLVSGSSWSEIINTVKNTEKLINICEKYQ